MPLDPQIATGIRPPDVQSPLQTLGQMMQLKRMQQDIAASQASEQNRQLEAQKAAKQLQDQQVLGQLLSAPNFTREGFLESVRTQAPNLYAGVLESYSKLDAQAETTHKAVVDAQAASARAANEFQSYLANGAAEVKARDYDPIAFYALAQHAKQAFPQFASHVDDYLKQAASGTPIASLTAGLIAQNTGQAKQVAEQPGQAAKSQQEQQVAANMVGGVTAQERAQNTVSQQRLAIERQNADLAAKKFSFTSGVDIDPEKLAYLVRQYQVDPAMGDKLIAGLPNAKAVKQALVDALARSGVNVQQLDSQSKLMRTAATSILPMIDKVQGLAKRIDSLGLMGTVGGRWRTLVTGESAASDIEGLTPDQKQLVGQFKSESGLLNSAVARAHGGARGGGSIQMLQYMKDLMSAQHADLNTYLGSLEGARAWMQDYANLGTAQPGTASPTGIKILKVEEVKK